MTPEQVADKLVRELLRPDMAVVCDYDAVLRSRIASALREAEERGRLEMSRQYLTMQGKVPPPGHILDDRGVVRRVASDENHPLPILADGALWVLPSYVWIIGDDGAPQELCVEDHGLSWIDGGWCFQYGDGDVMVSDCYSTAEAARAAAGKETP